MYIKFNKTLSSFSLLFVEKVEREKERIKDEKSEKENPL